MVTLYNGAVQLEFDSAKHKYTVDGQVVPSVTQITRVVDKGEALTNWAANKAVEYFRSGVQPNVEYDELYLEMLAERAKRAHRVEKQQAADIGTEVHRAIECELRGVERPAIVDPRVQNCFDAAMGWMQAHKVEPVQVERRVYSRLYKYCGTTDQVALVDGQLAVVDWKSSMGIYVEHLYQTAAYAQAILEEDGHLPGHRWLIRLGKEDGAFSAHHFGAEWQQPNMQGFLGAIQLFHENKVIAQALREGVEL